MAAAHFIDAHEQRNAARAPVRLVATLMTEFGDHTVRLRDLSRTGAGLLLDVLPAVGAIVVLGWRNLEILATVVWAQDGRCGLQFHEPISLAYILVARRLSEHFLSEAS